MMRAQLLCGEIHQGSFLVLLGRGRTRGRRLRHRERERTAVRHSTTASVEISRPRSARAAQPLKK